MAISPVSSNPFPTAGATPSVSPLGPNPPVQQFDPANQDAGSQAMPSPLAPSPEGFFPIADQAPQGPEASAEQQPAPEGQGAPQEFNLADILKGLGGPQSQQAQGPQQGPEAAPQAPSFSFPQQPSAPAIEQTSPQPVPTFGEEPKAGGAFDLTGMLDRLKGNAPAAPTGTDANPFAPQQAGPGVEPEAQGPEVLPFPASTGEAAQAPVDPTAPQQPATLAPAAMR